MVSEKWHRASIRIISEKLKAEEIADTIGIEPTKIYEKGDPVTPRNPQGLIREFSACIYDSEVSKEEPFHEHLDDLIEFIEENLEQFKQISLICEIDIFCGLFSESEGGDVFKIDASLIRRLAAFPVDIEIHLYPPSLPEIAE
ncbi:MAG: DUF4279 domain-containing protein [Cyanothece sp. SIO2G6]|nr:DUF4279 domain-containing protein [Cyanothece sp. SIO2G6]